MDERNLMKIERKTILNDELYLRQISSYVDFEKDDWEYAIKCLDEYCTHEDNCMAMASVQIGIPLRIVYLRKTDLSKLNEEYNERKIMINPKIIKSEGLTTYWEACASCLDNTGLIERPYRIEIEYYDEFKSLHHEIIEGFPCTVISHELDHLDGILHMDFALELRLMDKDERKEWRKTHPYEIIRKEGEYIHPLKRS